MTTWTRLFTDTHAEEPSSSCTMFEANVDKMSRRAKVLHCKQPDDLWLPAASLKCFLSFCINVLPVWVWLLWLLLSSLLLWKAEGWMFVWFWIINCSYTCSKTLMCEVNCDFSETFNFVTVTEYRNCYLQQLLVTWTHHLVEERHTSAGRSTRWSDRLIRLALLPLLRLSDFNWSCSSCYTASLRLLCKWRTNHSSALSCLQAG